MGNIIKIPTTNSKLDTGNQSPLWNVDNWVVVDGSVNGQEYFSLYNVPVETDGGGSGLALEFTLMEFPQYQINRSYQSQATGYEIGDTLFFTVPAGSELGNEYAFTLQTTITESMMTYEGDKMQYLPVFDSLNGLVLTVVPPPIGINNFWQIAKAWGNNAGCWKINITGGNDDNRVLITKAINEVFIKAAQSPNSHPTLELPIGVTCDSVDEESLDIQSPGPGPGGNGNGSGNGNGDGSGDGMGD
jgi:hypothetical protein